MLPKLTRIHADPNPQARWAILKLILFRKKNSLVSRGTHNGTLTLGGRAHLSHISGVTLQHRTQLVNICRGHFIFLVFSEIIGQNNNPSNHIAINRYSPTASGMDPDPRLVRFCTMIHLQFLLSIKSPNFTLKTLAEALIGYF
jgi:hypothetical protein